MEKNQVLCKKCNKIYSSPSSLSNHKKRMHQEANLQIIEKNNITSINCKFCNKLFSCSQNRWKHEKYRCKVKKNDEADKTIILDLQEKIIKLEEKIQNINVVKQPENEQNIITIVEFGEEPINVISKKDKNEILNSGYGSIFKLIDILHHSKKYPQFHNIQINNLKDKYLKIYKKKRRLYNC